MTVKVTRNMGIVTIQKELNRSVVDSMEGTKNVCKTCQKNNTPLSPSLIDRINQSDTHVVVSLNVFSPIRTT